MTDPKPMSSYFLGPKAENSQIFEALLLDIVRDVSHWRRNYFPSDSALITKSHQRQAEEDLDELEHHLRQLLADLRRNFPFHSPRYLGHQLSDVSMPALLGNISGLLYNPNNCTTEAAPVTVDWELEACDQLLKMVGFKTPPTPPNKEQDPSQYFDRLGKEFGWAHLTSGGTVANIEALWIARAVRYFPLAVKDIAEHKDLNIRVKTPSDQGLGRNLKDLTPKEVLLLKPNESIYLFSRYVEAIKEKTGCSVEQASEKAGRWLTDNKYSQSQGFFRAASSFEPCIFVSGAAHYSIRKSADILGIGQKNVIDVKMDSNFRMDPEDLKKKIIEAVDKGSIPVAVIAIAGTTEEGSVDPLHEICNVREELESQDISFWLHVDAAWGGYFRTLFQLSESSERDIVLRKIGREISIPYGGDFNEWRNIVTEKANSRAEQYLHSHIGDEYKKGRDLVSANRDYLSNKFTQATETGSPIDCLNRVKTILLTSAARTLLSGSDNSPAHPDGVDCCPGAKQADHYSLSAQNFKLGRNDRISEVQRYVSEKIRIGSQNRGKAITIRWSNKEVCRAFIAFPKAESITVDPHKMGYLPYSCGAVAFRNDRVRHFIIQKAPYISSASHNALVNQPPRRLATDEEKLLSKSHLAIDSSAPFTLEGSRPGSAAVAMRLSTQVLPLNRDGHGQLIKSSALSALELYERILRWNTIHQEEDFDFLPYQPTPPDTNIVIFAVRRKGITSIEGMNKLTLAVYRKFSIAADLGELTHSYSQPFFLSHTSFDSAHYPYDTLEHFFKKYNFQRAREEYRSQPLLVLRATVMNPYIRPLRITGAGSIVSDFMEELANAVRSSLVE
ncbi:pyridoxal phosphate-dependent decarboxylase family protein [Streptomyces sp. NPDC002667]|uniref:pyridoxal phosphate-dependent decarboxylase family protein n=1 Tax=Streptomyces sp. NPDC002667 TaxID=3364657 RepID=UPI0036C76A15